MYRYTCGTLIFFDHVSKIPSNFVSLSSIYINVLRLGYWLVPDKLVNVQRIHHVT
jgi:hypothetical protein